MEKRESFILGWVVAVGVAGCALPTHQTDAFLKEARTLPESVSLPDVPFVLQESNYCGPASLAMVMAYAGNPVPVETLVSQAYTPGKKGALQADLVGAARRNGMMAVEISGVSALLREIAAGQPVVTLQNLGLSWYSQWHYAVAIGYDLSAPDLLVHSGPDRATYQDLRMFERNWKDSGYWGLVVLRPGELAESAGDLAHTVAASGLEQVGKAREAEKSYAAILKRWPTSLGALIGMGNTRGAAGDAAGAARFLERAVRAHPHSAMAWHNLAIAQGAAGHVSRARESAGKAVEFADKRDQANYRQSLKNWLKQN